MQQSGGRNRAARGILCAAIVVGVGFLVIGSFWLRESREEGEAIGAPQGPERERTIPDLAYEDSAFVEARTVVPGRVVTPREVSPAIGESWECDLLVIDPLNQPISAASIRLQSESSHQDLGLTDEKGRWSLQVEAAEGQELVVEATGYQPKWIPVPPDGERPARMEIRLDYGGEINGIVLWSDRRGGAEPGLLVVAWPDSHKPSRPELIALAAGRAVEGTIRTRTEAGGTFVLQGLDPARRYSMTAGGAGVLARFPNLARPPVESVVPGGAPVEILVDAVFGVKVLLRESGGTELRTSSRVHGRGPVWSLPEEMEDGDTVENVWASASDLVLLGLPRLDDLEVGPEGPTPRNDDVLVYRSPQPDEPLGPLSYSARVPGAPLLIDADERVECGRPLLTVPVAHQM